jgi:hypothetical protein
MLTVARVAARAGKAFSSGAGILLMRGRRRDRGTDHHPAAHLGMSRLAVSYRGCPSLADA